MKESKLYFNARSNYGTYSRTRLWGRYIESKLNNRITFETYCRLVAEGVLNPKY